MALQSRTQRSLLMSFIGSIVFCGVVGIYCLLLGRMGWLAERVLGTTAAVGAASILALSSAVPWERRRWHPVGPLGVVVVAVALILIVIAIWLDLTAWRWRGFFNSMFAACVLAIALPHVGLLSLARLRRQFEWIRIDDDRAFARKLTLGTDRLAAPLISQLVMLGVKALRPIRRPPALLAVLPERNTNLAAFLFFLTGHSRIVTAQLRQQHPSEPRARSE